MLRPVSAECSWRLAALSPWRAACNAAARPLLFACTRGPALALAGPGARVVGQTIESAGPLASVGECCEIRDQFGRPHLAEVIGFRGSMCCRCRSSLPRAFALATQWRLWA